LFESEIPRTEQTAHLSMGEPQNANNYSGETQKLRQEKMPD
jgi:hypothetical protein